MDILQFSMWDVMCCLSPSQSVCPAILGNPDRLNQKAPSISGERFKYLSFTGTSQTGVMPATGKQTAVVMN